MTSVPSFDPRTLAKLQHLELRSRAISDTLLPGRHRHPRAGLSVEFSQHREYSPGDDLRHVDWKATARADRVLIRRFQDETSLVAWLLVDGTASMQVGDHDSATSKFDVAAVVSAALAWVVVRGRDAVGLRLVTSQGDVTIEPSDEPAQWHRLAAALAEHSVKQQELARALSSQNERLASSNDIATTDAEAWNAGLKRFASQVSAGSVVIAISDWLDDPAPLSSWLQLLKERRRVDLRVLQLLARDELDLPDWGETRFIGAEGEGEVAVETHALRDAYRIEVQRELQRLQQLFRSHAVPYRQATTDVDPAEMIRELL